MSKQHIAHLSPDFLVLLSHGGAPTAEQWKESLDHARKYIAELKSRGTTHTRRLIISVDGSALTTDQRREMDQLYRDADIACTTAVMTKSSAVRALFLVVRWVSKNTVRVFSLDDMAGAAQYLKLTAGEAFLARQELAKVSALKKSA